MLVTEALSYFSGASYIHAIGEASQASLRDTLAVEEETLSISDRITLSQPMGILDAHNNASSEAYTSEGRPNVYYYADEIDAVNASA